MRIFYFGKFGRHNTETYIAEALEKAGHSVYRAREYVYSRPERLAQDVVDYKSDIMLFAKGNAVFDFQKTLDLVKVPKVCWLFDLFFDAPANLNRTLDRPCFRADVVFTTDGGHDEEWKKYGITHEVVRQGIRASEHVLLEGERHIDVTFIGSNSYPYRQELHYFLNKNYTYLRQGLVGEVRGMDLNEYLGKTKIVVGDSVPTPHYWSNRLYEITGRGGFMIFPDIEGLKEEMPDIPTYQWGNFDDLKEKIDYYLAHDKEREEIRRRCFEKCGEYTYDTRVNEFLCKLEKYLV